MTVTSDGMRPLLLMKDETGEFTLPVPLGPLEAGVTLSQSNHMNVPSTPHKVTEILLQSMAVKITRCVFKDVRKNNQIVELELENHPMGTKGVEVRADEAMSLCLHLNVPIFASREIIHRSRNYVADLQGQAQALAMNPKLLQRTHPYLM
jgi:hypothetical protein